MSEQNDLDIRGEGRERKPEACTPWALLLPDAAEGLLSEAEQGALDRHIAGCSGCALELADAQRGAAWLALLKSHAPEPPASLVADILARTTGAEGKLASAAPAGGTVGALLPLSGFELGFPGYLHANSIRRSGFSAIWQQVRAWLGADGEFSPALQPRLAMTAAMAFFSICLTLNLLGFSVHSLRAEALRPSGLQRTASDMSASLVRSFEGIRIVYRVESRVNEWRTANAGQDQDPLHGAR